jgi:hypothetical protein
MFVRKELFFLINSILFSRRNSMRKKNSVSPILAGLIFGVMAFASCATTGGVDYAQRAARGEDVFAGKNWNAPRRNNMYDRWEFNTGGTFHFWHVHHGEPLDRGVYRYELNGGTITVTKEGAEGTTAAYTYAFSGSAVTLTPAGHGAAEQGAEEHAPGGKKPMGSLPKAAVTFTRAK